MKDDTIKQIKDLTPIVPFAEREGLLLKKQSAKTYVSLCCFHNEKTPSLKFYPDQGRYKCFGCGAHGDVINLYAHLHGELPIKQAVKEMAETLFGKRKKEVVLDEEHSRVYSGFKKLASSFSIKKEVITQSKEKLPATDIYNALLEYCGEISGTELEYLHSRGLTDETLKRFRVHSIKDYKKTVAHLRGLFPLDRIQKTSILSEKNQFLFSQHTILFPFIVNGEVVALRARYFYKGNHKTNRGKYRSTPLVQHQLFNGDLLKTLNSGDRVYLCEGEIDTMTLTQMGKNAVGLLGVGNYSEEVIKLLNNFDLVVAFDNDESGKREALKVCDTFFKQTGREAKREKLPDGIKDVNELYTFRLKNKL